MLRHLVLSIVLGTTLTLAGGGCRSCSSCHDYDGPVADCNQCGGGRTGSASHCGACSPCDGAAHCNCAGGACSSGDGSTGGCNCGNQGGTPSDEYYEGAPVMTEGEAEYQ
ncbi:MAG: hypothetical protein WD971_11055 [Pirellulales bacterium]